MDLTAFYVCYGCGFVSYLTLIFYPNSHGLAYFANVLLVTSIGGWFNTSLLILEMRVPHQNVGSVSALTRTLAVGSAVIAPTIAGLEAPYPYICVMTLATIGMLLTFALPPPGLNLPTAHKTGTHTSVLIDRQTNAPTLVHGWDPSDAYYPMTNYLQHISSFQ